MLINRKNKTTYQYLKDLAKQINTNLSQLKEKGFINRRNSKLSLINTKIANEKSNSDNLQLNVVPSYQLNDGKYSNNSWLNETPDPISKLTWGNAFYVSSTFAEENKLENGNIVKVETNGTTIKWTNYDIPGQNNKTITLTYGHGKINDGSFSGYGINADKFEPNNSYNVTKITKTGENTVLADSKMNHGLDEEKLAASGIENRIKRFYTLKQKMKLIIHMIKNIKYIPYLKNKNTQVKTNGVCLLI